MAAQDFLSFVTISGSSGFISSVESAIASLYGSSTMASILEARMYSGDPLDIAQIFGESHYDHTSLTVNIDPISVQSSFYVNQFAEKVFYNFERVLMHELLHAAFHPTLDDPSVGDLLQGVFRGPIVDFENLISGELGDSNVRTGYFGGSAPYLPSYDYYSELSLSSFGQIVENSAFLNNVPLPADSTGVALFASGSGDNFLYGGLGTEIIYGGGGSDLVSGGGGNDFLLGDAGDDSLYGDTGADLIIGGAGSDDASGGTGADTIYADLDDLSGGRVLDGGSGRDVLYFGEPVIDVRAGVTSFVPVVGAVVLNASSAAAILAVEAIHLGNGSDEIHLNNRYERVIAGGDGDDLFVVSSSLAAIGFPQIIWGGAGADTISLTSTEETGPAGILVVTAENITEENFHLVDLEALGLGDDFKWEEIDVVLINPDSTDRIEVNGQELNVVDSPISVFDSVEAPDPDNIEGYQVIVDAYTSAGYIQVDVGGDHPGFLEFTGMTALTQLAVGSAENGYSSVYTFDASFLGGEGFHVFAAAGFQSVVSGYTLVDTQGGEEENLGFLDYSLPASPIFNNLEVQYSYTDSSGQMHYREVNVSFYLTGWYGFPDGTDEPLGGLILASISGDGAPFNFGILSVDDVDFTSSEGLGDWFILGATLAGTVITPGGGATQPYSLVLPDPEDANAGSGSAGGGPLGGNYVNGSQSSNMKSGEGVNRLSSFNAAKQTLVINGQALSASTLAAGMTATETNGNTVIQYGEDDFVVLRGVSLAEWQAGSATQILGGTGGDSLTGTSAADVIAGGGGNDTITAGSGNDRINYTSGNDVISGGGAAYGSDTLDLGRFDADEVTFRVSGNDVVVTTPDGTITLGSQIRFDIGHSQSNIETILFAGGTLDEAGIRARAVADQATAGNDNITGTAFNDVISGGTGNDTVAAGSGNDTIAYTSGNDLISGGGAAYGTDTLDLSQFDAGDVTFRVSGNDVVITTPDGTVTLGSQIRFDVGHSQSNIETILFADGSITEAGIRTRAVADQTTTGNDSITGTAFNDVISGGTGNDTVAAGSGNDTIAYTSGNDLISGGGAAYGTDTLDLSQFDAGDVTFRVSGNDVVITTPDGTVTLGLQIRFDVGHSQSNIEAILFADGSITEAGIRARAVDDQATAGNDSIVGSAFNDVVNGGTGNDTLRGNAGADDFVFASGDDQDRIMDFALAADQLRFEGLTLADLTVTQAGSNTVITYGDGDSLTLVNILASNLQTQHYDFV